MTLFEFPVWKIWGMNGVAEWQTNWIIISKLTRGPSNRVQSPRISWTIALHLWHGTLAGIIFGLLLPVLTLLPAGNLSVLLDALVYSVALWVIFMLRSEEHTSELQSRPHLVCRLLLEKKKNI